METREAPMEDVPLSVAPVDKSATKRSLVETYVSKVTPSTEAVVTDMSPSLYLPKRLKASVTP